MAQVRVSSTAGVASLNPAGTAALFGGLIFANLAAWAWAFAVFADRPAVMGTALLAWVLGLRHAVDADHIAAIDNVVRKLMHTDAEPRSVGLYISRSAIAPWWWPARCSWRCWCSSTAARAWSKASAA
jgi:high-affinity nickel permease